MNLKHLLTFDTISNQISLFYVDTKLVPVTVVIGSIIKIRLKSNTLRYNDTFVGRLKLYVK